MTIYFTIIAASLLLSLTFFLLVNNSFHLNAQLLTASALHSFQTPSASHSNRIISSHFFSGFVSTLKAFRYQRLIPELFQPLSKPPKTSKVIIIGSGFGGSVSAYRLAQAGIQTTVLERGQDWPIDRWRSIHAYEPLRDGRGLWHKKSSRVPLVAANALRLPVDYFGGMLDITEYRNIEIWRAACVGGGSKVFTGVMIQPERQYFEQIFQDSGVTYDEMNNVYYPLVRERLKLSPIPDDIYESDPYGNSRVWDEQARNAGYTVSRPDSIFDWDILRKEMNGKSKPSAIIGMSNMGNSNGAKFDMTQNYLLDAKNTGHVQVYSNQHVREISNGGSVYKVHVDVLSPAGFVVDTHFLECEYLILAAGSVGTTELLLKAREKELIPGLQSNAEIGLGWGSNGDMIVSRSFNPIRGKTQGAPSSSLIHDATGPVPVTFQSWYVPGVPVDVGVQGTLGIAFDMENRGQFVFNRSTDSVQLEWPEDGNGAAAEAGRLVNDKMAYAMPKSKPGIPFMAPDVWAGFTAHPLGGCVLRKATDGCGRVKGVRKMYVMDGAVIPGSTGAVNPSLTISALVERNIEKVILEDF